MRTILIDPEAQTVTELDFKGNYKKIQETISCSCFTTLNLDNATNDAVFVDDEGMFNTSGFVFQFYNAKLIGKGLIMGCDAEGESAPAGISLDEVKNNIQWLGECTFNL